jgi:VWFA-related protein
MQRSAVRESSFIVLALMILAIASSDSVSKQTTQAREVSLTVTITDKDGRYVGGLSSKQITVRDEGGTPEFRLEEANAPMSIGILLDMPALKRTNLGVNIRNILLQYTPALGSHTEYSIASLDDSKAFEGAFINDTAGITLDLDNLAKSSASGKGLASEAINSAINELSNRANRKHVLLLILNDAEKYLKRSLPELIDRLKRSDIILYALRLPDPNGFNLKSSALNEMCSITGGTVFYPTKPREFDDVFDVLTLELQHQYSLVFKAASQNSDADWHRLDVTIQPLNVIEKSVPKKVPLFVRVRSGYYPHP